MTEQTTTLLLTRPEAQSQAFLAQCETALGARISAVIAPLLRIAEVGEFPDLSAYGTLVATSSHAIRRLDAEGLLRGRKVAVVGEATGTLAQTLGAEAQVLGEDVEAFLSRSSALVAPCLYVRGRHVRRDLASDLRALGRETDEVVVYDQIAEPLSRAGRTVLAGREPVVVPLFSPRTAQLLSRVGDVTAPLKVVTMSAAVADAWSGAGDVTVVGAPTAEAMCASVIEVL